MRPRSLRARLGLWHAGLLALTLLVLAGLTLWFLRGFLHSRADAALHRYADTTSRSISMLALRAETNETVLRPPFLNKELQEWGRQIQVVDAETGEVLDRSDGLRSHPLPRDLTARVRALRGQETFQTRADLGEYPVRIVTVPVFVRERIPFAVQTAASLEGIEDALQRASLLLLILTPSVFVVSLFGGRLLVGRSLKTVDDITRAALAIDPKSLDRRVHPTGADDEISRLASAFNEMIGRLDESFRQVRRFSADASHELRTPLTTIRGESEVALMGEREPEDYRRALRTVLDEAERMSAIVENLLLLAKADANQVPIEMRPVDLADILLSVYERMEPVAARHEVRLAIEEAQEAPVMGDELWLGQILANLVTNAIKYTPPGEAVTLAVRRSQEDMSVRACVADRGPGIEAEHLPRIFDRFYRVDSGRSRDAGGSGLGLNIAQWAAHAHGGEIEVQSEPGKGTTFTLRLPVETG